MDCAGVCSSSTPANGGSTYGATAGTFGKLINNIMRMQMGILMALCRRDGCVNQLLKQIHPHMLPIRLI